jgi:metal-dependent HD superfamily phosphatase/phosphodiesterase
VSNIALNILTHLKEPSREAELAAIAGFLHDIGNVVSRENHAQAGAVLIESILSDLEFPVDEIAEVVAAIGNHHEQDGDPVSKIAAAVILADKSDVHRTRVRNPDMIRFDIHDRVNYAATNSFIWVDEGKKTITLELTIDTTISHLMEYFEIFLSRMLISRRAANFLSCTFELVINGNRMV